MDDPDLPKAARRWHKVILWKLGLSAFLGCGPSTEQLAVEAFNRGNAHAHLDDFDEAIADYTEAIRLEPEFAEAYYNRGIAYRGIDQQAKADSDLAKADQLGYMTE